MNSGKGLKAVQMEKEKWNAIVFPVKILLSRSPFLDFLCVGVLDLFSGPCSFRTVPLSLFASQKKDTSISETVLKLAVALEGGGEKNWGHNHAFKRTHMGQAGRLQKKSSRNEWLNVTHDKAILFVRGIDKDTQLTESLCMLLSPQICFNFIWYCFTLFPRTQLDCDVLFEYISLNKVYKMLLVLRFSCVCRVVFEREICGKFWLHQP